MNFFYIFAGVDSQLIQSCPVEERVRNIAIGFVVFLISAMGFLSISYACVMFVEINAKDTLFSILLTYFLCIFLGLVWFLIISNIYRACLTISGIGDGTSKITKNELLNAIPQFILLIFLGYCLSAPMTVLLLNKELLNISSTSDIDRLYLREKNLTNSRIDNFDFNIESIKNKQPELMPVAYKDLNKKQEMYNKKNSHSFVGILIKCYSQHTVLSLVILFFTIFLYLIPIILRMMWVKGHYEYKVDFQNRLVLEKYGIYPDYYMVNYNRQNYHQDKFLASETAWVSSKKTNSK